MKRVPAVVAFAAIVTAGAAFAAQSSSLAAPPNPGSATATPAPAPTASAAAPAPVQRMLVEIYRIAPGKHTEFLEAIASYDEANLRAGLPARQLYVHSDGASWDFMLIQPAETPDDKAEALGKAWDELGLPGGADFFLGYREFIAEHEDTFVKGPTTAAAFLATRSKK